MNETHVANYYQTLGPLTKDIQGTDYTHYCLAAVHFGTNDDGTPYMHLNDHEFDDPVFARPFEQLQELHAQGAVIRLMIGGAGSAFQQLFANFATYYGMLASALRSNPWITGIDLDVEEQIGIDQIRTLIRSIDRDFGPAFQISMAPLASSLAENAPGMGGFVYRDLLATPEGKRIDWFNGQFYGGSFSHTMVDAIVANGVPAAKIVMGMLASEFPTAEALTRACQEVRTAKRDHPELKGVFVWEHDLANPTPLFWAKLMSSALQVSSPEKVKHALLNRPLKAKRPAAAKSRFCAVL